MATKEIKRRVLVEFVGDASKLKKSQDDIQKGNAGVSKSFKSAAGNMQEYLASGQGALSRFARAASGHLESVLKGVSGLGTSLQGVVSKIDGVAKAMAPWNQALELGNKVVRFATQGLDAYAKTSAEAAKEVNALKTEFEGYRDAVMAGVGKLTVELLKPAYAFEEQRKKLMEISNTPAFRLMYGASGQRMNLDQMIESNLGEGAAQRLEQLGYVKIDRNAAARRGGMTIARTALGVGQDLGALFTQQTESLMDGVSDAAKKAWAASEAAAKENARWVAEFRAMQLGNDARNVALPEWAKNRREFDVGSINTGLLGQDASIAKALDAFNELTTREDRYASSAGRRTESFLESHFGPIEDFDYYKLAFEGLTTAVSSATQAWISGSMSLGSAIKKGIGEALAGTAVQLLVEGGKHLAFAAGSVAFGDLPGAGRHLAAAGVFAAKGALAAAGARMLGAGASAAGAGGGGGGGYGAGAGGGGPSYAGSGGSAQGERVIVVVGDYLARNSPRMQQLHYEEIVDATYGGSGVSNR